MIVRNSALIRRLLPKNAFARGVSVLAGGTAGAQLLTILAAPLLTRLYSPEDFGMLAVYASLLALIGVISSFRYELAITLPEDDVEAANLAVLSLLLVLLTTVLIAVLVTLLANPVATVLGVPAMAGYFWLLPVGVLLSGGYTVFNYWCVRNKRFTAIATTRLRQALATIVVQLSAFKLGGIALLLGHVMGQSAGTVNLARPALTSESFKQVSWAGIKRAVNRYRRFPLFTTWSGLFNVAGHKLPPLLFASLFGVAAAGLYALSHRILSIPASLVGSAIAKVFLSLGAEAHRGQRLSSMYQTVQEKLIQIGLPPMFILIVTGPDLFAFLFGEEWREAGVIAQWLSISMFASFLVSPLSMIFTILEKQSVGLLLQVILFLSRLVGIGIGVWYDSIMLSVAMFSLGGVFGYSLYLILGVIYTKTGFYNLLRALVTTSAYALLIITPVIWLSHSTMGVGRWIGWVISLSFLLIYYMLIVQLSKNEI